MVVKGDLKAAARGRKVQFVVDCQTPVDDNILDPSSLRLFLADRIKVNGKTGNLGEKIQVLIL